MPVFTCSRCKCIDNSALGGTYWTRTLGIYPKPYKGELLCVVCAPPVYNDGTLNKEAGTWHNKFPRLNPEGQPVTLGPEELAPAR